jgi:hypothetical protein
MARAYAVYGGGFGSGTFKVAGRTASVEVKDGITPVLNGLEKHLKSDLFRAARHTAYTLMVDIKSGIRKGSADGISIPNRKVLDGAAMIRVYNQFKTRKVKNGALVRDRMLRYSRRFMGNEGFGTNKTRNLLNAVNYAKIPNVGAVVGWGSKSSPYWGTVVQEARRGKAFGGGMSFVGTQPFTQKQRKFFAAIGLPTKKAAMTQPKAAFFEPFIRRRAGWVGRTMAARIDYYIKGREASASARASLRGVA